MSDPTPPRDGEPDVGAPASAPDGAAEQPLPLSSSARSVLNEAVRLARATGATRAGADHLVLALFVTPGIPSFVLGRSGLSPGDVFAAVSERRASRSTPRDAIAAAAAGAADAPARRFDGVLDRLLDEARATARAAGLRAVEPEHLLRAVLDPDRSPAASLLRRLGAEVEELGRAAELFVRDLPRARHAPATAADATDATDATEPEGLLAALGGEWRVRRFARRVAVLCGAAAHPPGLLLATWRACGPLARTLIMAIGGFPFGYVMTYVVLSVVMAVRGVLDPAGGDGRAELHVLVGAIVGNGVLLGLLLLWLLPRTARWVLIARLDDAQRRGELAPVARLRLAGELIAARRASDAVDAIGDLARDLGVELGAEERLDVTTAYAVTASASPRARLAGWQRVRAAVRLVRRQVEK